MATDSNSTFRCLPHANEEASIGPFLGRVIRFGADLRDSTTRGLRNDAAPTHARARRRAERQPRIQWWICRRFGKEGGAHRGIDAARGDAVIPIDVGCRIPRSHSAAGSRWREGYEVVLARRTDRTSDTWFKRFSARIFYRLHNRIADESIPEDVGDFRLLARPVVDALKGLPERRRFMKGLFAWVGFRTATVEYAREPRHAGDSKFNGWRLWNLALEGVTSFSTFPLRVWTYLGLIISAASLSYAGYILVRTLIHGVDVPGYASLLVSILFLGGVQLIGLGVLGEYVGRIYRNRSSARLHLRATTKRTSVATHLPPGTRKVAPTAG